MIEALLWDVDGTLAETERDGHRVAFNRAFEALGLPWHWDEAHYGRLLRVTGGRERLLLDMPGRPEAPALASEREALARELHQRKNAVYAELVAGGSVTLRPAVRELIEQAAARGLRQAIVTTTSRSNVQALLRHSFGAEGARLFRVMLCAEDVAAKKPDPQAYQRALAMLDLSPLSAVALEDSPGGVAAARAAEVPVVVTRSAYFPDDAVEGAIAIGPGLHTREGWTPAPAGPAAEAGAGGPARITLDDLIEWHTRMELVSHFG